MPNYYNYVDQSATNPYIDAATRSAVNIGTVAGQFLDPNSQIYQQYGQQLQERLNAASPTLNSLLGLQRSAGLGGQGGTAIANEQRQAIEARNRSAASSGQRDFFTSLAQTGAGLLGQEQQAYSGLAQQRAQREQFKQSQPTFGDQLLGIGAGLLGYGLSGPASMLSGMLETSNMFGGNSIYGTAYNPGTSYFNPQTGKVEFR